MAGVARAGWQLTYSATPTETFLQDEIDAGVTNLDTSLGAQLGSNGVVRSVVWNSPAFRAGLSPGAHILTVNGKPFTRDTVLDAEGGFGTSPLHLTFQDADIRHDVTIPNSGPLRYPHLSRVPGAPDRLMPLLTAR
jgi:predicted metalloprotease with PDZ domain